MMLVGLSQLEGWDGGGGGQRQSPDIPMKGKLRTVWGLVRWRGSHLRTASSDLRGMPPEGRLPLRGGEDVVGLGFLAGVFCLKLTTCPLTRGGHSRPCELPNKGAPDGRAGEQAPSEGELGALPTIGGGRTKPYCGEMGSWGKRRGDRLGSFRSTDC